MVNSVTIAGVKVAEILMDDALMDDALMDKSMGSSCPCGSGQLLSACCGLLHAAQHAQSAEQIMR